jgi:acetate kinase
VSALASGVDDCIAVLNAGSSSLKFSLYGDMATEALLFHGQIDGLNSAPALKVEKAGGRTVAERHWPEGGLDHDGATAEVLRTARELIGNRGVAGVGHRVVHGGAEYAAPVRIDAGVIASLRKLVPLAPLHQPHNLAPIETIARVAPAVAQVACFDTAFHRRQPPLAQMFGLPRRFSEEGVQRYGFHGLSYEYVSRRFAELAPDLAKGRVIIAHLGSGASLCGLVGGRSMATTMGFTAADGLLMGTRCGALDPGVLLHLMDNYGMDARGLEDLIYKRSGLLGVSGISADMRALRSSPEPHAAEAVALFVYRVVREIGSIAAALGGVDALVFTGGIGENDAATRAEILEGCTWLGVAIDPGRNAQPQGRVSRDGSAVEAWVVPTDEELMIARHTASVLGRLPADA